MRSSFAALGLPEVIVSDNAATFTSDEFGQFLKRNGIRHVRTPPYHPASNGLVERAVQTFKEGLKKLTEGSLSTRLARFLFKYRITPHSTMGVSPAELMYGRRLRSQLDQLHPDLGRKVCQSQDQQKRGHDVRSQVREFKVGDKVYARNYGQGPLWLPGEVVAVCGLISYSVALDDGRNVHRHTEQLRSRTCRSSAVVPGDDQVPEEDVEGFDVGGTRNVLTGGIVTDSVELTPSTNESSPVVRILLEQSQCKVRARLDLVEL